MDGDNEAVLTSEASSLSIDDSAPSSQIPAALLDQYEFSRSPGDSPAPIVVFGDVTSKVLTDDDDIYASIVSYSKNLFSPHFSFGYNRDLETASASSHFSRKSSRIFPSSVFTSAPGALGTVVRKEESPDGGGSVSNIARNSGVSANVSKLTAITSRQYSRIFKTP
ncbi:hypothetical protein RJ640_013627 [Escallonia rubra]|uniref:Uncharacterized protein n=1 Tax=Escallonia rubra TaxID=112253 RepID=A0AA88UA84_9ASTE|nr:hypothetical protein RJ640_013627 [Escallonia rubra]